MRNLSRFCLAALTCGTLALTAQAQTPSTNAPFALKNGDRVVFYGDSITDQRMYTLLTEQYIVTRFPNLNVRFVHSGWGGDRVTGGGGGPIDLRLDRDVTAYKPSVVTVMLGMNDASYRAFDAGIFQTYADGYKHLVEKVKKDNPGVRLTLIQPSPFDDVTRPESFPGGYNAVLLRYANFVGQLAGEQGAGVADLNNPVVAMLKKANATDPTNAAKLIPDRVHPGWGGHLIMAECLLKSWNAPALVSSVRVDAASGKSSAQNAKVSKVQAKDGTVSWSALESALPFPLASPDPNNAAPYNLAVASSDFVQALDQETLTVTNLAAPRYTLKVDGKGVGEFTKEQLAAGVNLATLNTPMLQQALLVGRLTQLRSNVHNSRWREYQVPQASDPQAAQFLPTLLKNLDAADEPLTKAQRDAAKPRAHQFVLEPK
ncbi:SGNH/GDSL hydrolase family protein [Armatimonas rosea]|uniref:Lysophospholipase L1-like esterase n=1 Tax=Armatimonas rosea TaxID=685828 RepID=A0A7W9SSE1_ARMRO|nr:SGNH/GDSL hydrolase family protein [Armatimonas rosea]MBB6051520.1 lysophospholipase L1-like esterase [Armatimonas rosea]